MNSFRFKYVFFTTFYLSLKQEFVDPELYEDSEREVEEDALVYE